MTRPIITTQPLTVKPIQLAPHQTKASRVTKSTPPTSPTHAPVPPTKTPL
jgi:hypothetical protein